VAPVSPGVATRKRYPVQGNPAHPSGIEGGNMRKVYYNPMPRPTVLLPVVFLTILCAAHAAQQQPTALKTSALESHEGMTVSARPILNAAEYKEKFNKKSPYAAGVLAMQVIFRNDSDLALKVGLDTIRLNLSLGDSGEQQLRALSPEEVADAVMHPGQKSPGSIRDKIPLPIPRSTSSKDKNWVAVQSAAQLAAVPSSVVGPHSTVQGWLYFDLQGQFNLLNSSHLYVPDVKIMRKDQRLTYFEIDMSRASSN
jgi:hypothetical protein